MADNVPIFVVFDFDKTISKYDTYIPFLMMALRSRPWRIFFAAHLPFMILLYCIGRLDNAGLKTMFSRAVLKGAPRRAVKALAARFAYKLRDSGFHAGALAAIAKHRAEKHHLILASASFDIYVEPVAGHLGFDTVICTKAEWENEALTGGLLGKNCYGEAKLEAVASFLAEKKGPRLVMAYSDHYSDLPLLLFSDQACLVNPSATTRNKLAEYHFPEISWR